MKKAIMKKAPRYECRTDIRTLEVYEDLDWAIHSAECFATFFDTDVAVIDRLFNTEIATARPEVVRNGLRKPVYAPGSDRYKERI